MAKAARKASRKASRDRAQLLLRLAFGLTVTGLSLVNAAHDMRGLYRQLGEVQREQDALLEEHSRLMLERGALTSMQNIEAVAQSQLDMRFPEDVGQVLR